MNKFLKTIALLAAVMMAFSAFTACGEKTNDPASNDDQSQNQPADNDSKDDSGEQTDSQAVVPALTINGENVDISDNPVIFTVGGIDIRFDEYRYMFKYYESYYATYRGITSDMWEGNEQNFEVFKEDVKADLIEQNFGNIVAKKYDVTLSDEDYEQVDEYMEEEKAQFDTEEAFNNALAASGIKEELLRNLITSSVMCEKVYNDLYAGENARLLPSDEEIKQDLKDNYVRAYHLLVGNYHFENTEGYEDADEETLKAAAKTFAEEKLAEIQAGADIYELAQSVGDDPGMQENPEGYLFTYGQMVPEFEEASFALGVDEISGIVETDYGYHIIKRIEQDNYIEENFETVKEQYKNDFFNTEVNQILADAEIVYSEFYDDITYNSIT